MFEERALEALARVEGAFEVGARPQVAQLDAHDGAATAHLDMLPVHNRIELAL